MQGIPYKDTFAAKGSELYKALTGEIKTPPESVYAATTKRMQALYNPIKEVIKQS